LLSTKAGSTFFDFYTNNPVTSAAQAALNPVLSSQYGQWALDKLTSGMMRGYDDEWKDKRNFNTEEQSWEWDGTETAEDINNYARFNNAISGDGSIIQSFVENGGNKTGMWELDEQYFYTDAERDKDSIVSGILTKPIEEGGSPTVPIVATPEGKGNEQSGSGGKQGDTQSNASDKDSNDGDLDANGINDDGNQASSGGVAGWFDSNGNWVGTNEGKAFINDNGLIDPSVTGDAIFVQQMIEAIATADLDPNIDKQNLIDEYNSYVGTGSFASTIDAGDSTLTGSGLEAVIPTTTTTAVATGVDNNKDIPQGGDQVLLPGDDSVVLPPTSGGVSGLPLDIIIPNNNGLPLLWDGLFPYSPWKGYTGKRKKLYSEMMNKLGTIKPDKGWLTSAFNPRLKELEEAGLIK